ncbi:MAG: dihydrofolate reductase [Bacteroidota bacterium]|nr:dihydrofolate reductase [Bacteroidota bacterium]
MAELILIAAIDQNNGLGYKNHLLCHLHDDLKNFKRLTSGHTVVMGHKTWDSLSVKPLPNRKNIVLSRQSNATFAAGVASMSVNDLLASCSEDEKVFIMGGAEVYKQFIAIADRLIITHIQHSFIADVFFPEIDEEKWIKIKETKHPNDERHAYAFNICEYVRRNQNNKISL